MTNRELVSVTFDIPERWLYSDGNNKNAFEFWYTGPAEWTELAGHYVLTHDPEAGQLVAVKVV